MQSSEMRRLSRAWATLREAVAGGEHDFTSGSLPRAVLLLSVPMILEMAMESVFGVLDALTPSVQGTLDRTVEPLTNYAVVSAQQDLRGGNTGINVIATAVNRSLDEWTDVDPRANIVNVQRTLALVLAVAGGR